MKKRKTVKSPYLEAAAEDADFISKILTNGTDEEIEEFIKERKRFYKWRKWFDKRCEMDKKNV